MLNRSAGRSAARSGSGSRSPSGTESKGRWLEAGAPWAAAASPRAGSCGRSPRSWTHHARHGVMTPTIPRSTAGGLIGLRTLLLQASCALRARPQRQRAGQRVCRRRSAAPGRREASGRRSRRAVPPTEAPKRGRSAVPGSAVSSVRARSRRVGDEGPGVSPALRAARRRGRRRAGPAGRPPARPHRHPASATARRRAPSRQRGVQARSRTARAPRDARRRPGSVTTSRPCDPVGRVERRPACRPASRAPAGRASVSCRCLLRSSRDLACGSAFIGTSTVHLDTTSHERDGPSGRDRRGRRLR